MSFPETPPHRAILSEFFRVSRFAIIGIAAAIVHIGIALSLVRFSDLHPFLANAIAFLTAFLVSFFGHYYWTFRCSGDPRRTMARFFGLSLSGFVVNNAVLGVLLESGKLSVYVAMFLAACVIPVFTYLLSRLWIFELPEQAPELGQGRHETRRQSGQGQVAARRARHGEGSRLAK